MIFCFNIQKICFSGCLLAGSLALAEITGHSDAQAATANLEWASNLTPKTMLSGKTQVFDLTPSPLLNSTTKVNAPKKVLVLKKPLWGRISLAGRSFTCAFEANEASGTPRLVIDADDDGALEPSDYTLNLKPVNGSDAAESEATAILPLPGTAEADYRAVISVFRATNWTLNGVKTQWKLTLRSLGWRKGILNWQGREIMLGVQDTNSNGRFDDPFNMASQESGDALYFDLNGDGQFQAERELFRGSRYLHVDNKLCEVIIAPGGARISIVPTATAPVAIHCEAAVKSVRLTSDRGALDAPVENGTLNLPPGRYFLTEWIAQKTGTDGQIWKLTASNENPSDFDAQSGLKMNLISPVAANLSADQQGGGIRFSLSLTLAGGETVRFLAPQGIAPSAPQLRIFDRSGLPYSRLALKAEGNSTYGAFWQPPIDAPSVLRARLELDTGPFSLQNLPDWEFAVPKNTR